MDGIELTLFNRRIQSVCDEMGAVLMRTALSPNIKDRLDFSCAVFDAGGELTAQAAHIPVHLGSMAYAMADIVNQRDWKDGDMVILNDPYLGGTHLPDVTVITPVFAAGRLCAFVANRAHHADIGSSSPGSMPLATKLEQEGVIISPTLLMRDSQIIEETFSSILGQLRNPQLGRADFSAQISANLTGRKRLAALIGSMKAGPFTSALKSLNDYAESLARNALQEIPAGRYRFTDFMDDDGQGNSLIPVKVTLTVDSESITVDFSDTADQVAGNINCPLSVAAAAVYYVFYCLMPPQTPACAGSFRPLSIKAPPGSLLNARYPAAVAAGNVETSSRVVDVMLGALASAIPARIPAASHGSMNNIAMGGADWDYYETLGGGMGAGPSGGGLDAVQTHMTNTLNTPIEILEKYYPLRIRRYAIRAGSGGLGRRPGGEGVVREYEFLQPATVSLLTERRERSPWGLAGGGQGACGQNLVNGETLPAKTTIETRTGDRLLIQTAGGGGWGKQ